MKVRYASILLVLSAALGLKCPDHGPTPGPLVFVLAGQSNMKGYGVTAELPPDLAALPPNVRYFPGSPPANFSGRATFGPEVSFAHQLAQTWPHREIWIIKHAVSGTSLLAWAPDWDSTRAASTGNADAGPVYDHLFDIIAEANAPGNAEFGGVLWMQGETDTGFAAAAAEYFDNLSQLIAAFRLDLDSPTLPFVLGVVNPLLPTHPYLSAVTEAQRRAAAEIPHVHVVETDGLTKLDDQLHYDTAGQLELGRRFAAMIVAIRAAT